MMLRLEVFGRRLEVDWFKTQPPAAETDNRPPDSAPTPMVVYAEPPLDPVGERLGFCWQEDRGNSDNPHH